MKLATRIFRREDWYVTSPYGYRTNPFTKEKEFHGATDYGTKRRKWEQYALEDGTVLAAGVDKSGAIFAWVRYPRLGIDLLHYHLDSLNVKPKQLVTKDTIIGKTGKTGKATGVHLHLAMRQSGTTKRLDPHKYNYEEHVEPVKPEVKPVADFKKGDKVVPTRLVNYSGTKLRQYDKEYIITQIKGDRAVLSAPRHGKLITWAAMNTKDIKKV